MHSPLPAMYISSLHDALPISRDVSESRLCRAPSIGASAHPVVCVGERDTTHAILARKLHRAVGGHHSVHRTRSSLDRKSTRLNSSHLVSSYAVFCLKKKKNEVNYSICKERKRLNLFDNIFNAG